jgi:hypothetical protein
VNASLKPFSNFINREQLGGHVWKVEYSGMGAMGFVYKFVPYFRDKYFFRSLISLVIPRLYVRPVAYRASSSFLLVSFV